MPMNKTHIRPARDLRNNYTELAKIIKDKHDHVIITNRGRGDMVLIDFEEYTLFEQYLHQKYIDEKLEEAIMQAQMPETKWIRGVDVIKQAKERVAQLEHVKKES